MYQQENSKKYLTKTTKENKLERRAMLPVNV